MKVIDQVRCWADAEDDILVAIVFGSHADGRSHDQSDVDVAVLAAEPLSVDRRLTLAKALEDTLGREVDLVDITARGGTIVREALTRGVRVKNSDPSAFAKRIKRFWLDEADFAPLVRRIYAERRNRVFGQS